MDSKKKHEEIKIDNISDTFENESTKELKHIVDQYNSNDPALRYNDGKKRFDLVHAWSHEQMVNVLTKGSEKYPERNWEKGMKWGKIIASAKRHLNAIEQGEDYDSETGELHAAHLACNIHFLTAYYKIYPQGDDRPHHLKKPLKIGLSFVDMFIQHKPILPFKPYCYFDTEKFEEEFVDNYLKKYNYPIAKIYTDIFNNDEVFKSEINIFVVGTYSRYIKLNNKGVCTYLFNTDKTYYPDLGYRRIFDLKDLT